MRFPGQAALPFRALCVILAERFKQPLEYWEDMDYFKLHEVMDIVNALDAAKEGA